MLLGFLSIAMLLDFVSIPLLYGVFFLMDTAETLLDTASVSILPAVAPRESLEKANGRLFGAQIVANEFDAPPLGGLLFAVAASGPFLLDAGAFAAATALMLTMQGKFRVERPEGATPTTLRAEIYEGLRWLWRNRLLRTLAMCSCKRFRTHRAVLVRLCFRGYLDPLRLADHKQPHGSRGQG